MEDWGGRWGEGLRGDDLAQARDIAHSLNASAEQSIAQRRSKDKPEKRERRAQKEKSAVAPAKAPAASTVATHAEQLRQRLMNTACDRRTVTWDALIGGISDDLDALPYSARWEVLARVDVEPATTELLLSAPCDDPGRWARSVLPTSAQETGVRGTANGQCTSDDLGT